MLMSSFGALPSSEGLLHRAVGTREAAAPLSGGSHGVVPASTRQVRCTCRTQYGRGCLHTRINTYMYIHVHMYVCTYVRMYACVDLSIVYLLIHVLLCTYFVHIYICIHICTYLHIYTHTFVYTYTYDFRPVHVTFLGMQGASLALTGAIHKMRLTAHHQLPDLVPWQRQSIPTPLICQGLLA